MVRSEALWLPGGLYGCRGGLMVARAVLWSPGGLFGCRGSDRRQTDAGEVERTMAQALRFAKKNAALVESDVQADKEVAATREKDLKAAASDLWPKCSTAGEEALLRSVSRGDMVRSSH